MITSSVYSLTATDHRQARQDIGRRRLEFAIFEEGELTPHSRVK